MAKKKYKDPVRTKVQAEFEKKQKRRYAVLLKAMNKTLVARMREMAKEAGTIQSTPRKILKHDAKSLTLRQWVNKYQKSPNFNEYTLTQSYYEHKFNSDS